MINGPNIPQTKLIPVMAMFNVQTIIGTCIGIEDSQNLIPHSYIFLPSHKNWPSLFSYAWLN